MLTAPQVTLRTRGDNLVSTTVGFAGQLLLSTGGQPALTEVLLSATVLTGLVTQVSTIGNTQQVTVGLNLAVASVTAVDVTVLAGPPLANVFTAALTAAPVLGALTSALQSVPANLVQVTPQGINLPFQVVQTYQPPKGSLFFPDTLFQLQFAVSRIVARPLDASSGATGVLAVAIDMSAPVATSGDAGSLTDITGTVPTGPNIEYGNNGATQFAPGGGAAQATCGVALYIDNGWVTSVINTVLAPQLAGKFLPQLAANNVSFSNTPDCMQVTFGNVTAALNDPLSPPIPTNVPMPGMALQLKLTRWISVSADILGHYHGNSGPGTADVTFNAQIILLLVQNAQAQQPDPKPPLLTNDFYAAYAIGTDLSLPWWVEVAAILAGGPAYIVGSAIAGLFGVDIFYPTIVANVNNQAGQGLQGALGGLFQQQNTQLMAQLPGTTVPDWYLTVAGLGILSDICYTCVDLMPLPAGRGSSTGSFPYVMLTDQPVSNPNSVPNDVGYPFPVRFDGSFNWPGIAYNQQGQGVLGGSLQWDVHDINPVGAVLKVPPGMFSPNDPTMFVSWTVTRTDTNAQVLTQTLSLGQPGALAVSIDHASAGLQAADGYQITCTMSQILADGSTQGIFNSGKIFVQIEDVFDRHHPYATWPGTRSRSIPGNRSGMPFRRSSTSPGGVGSRRSAPLASIERISGKAGADAWWRIRQG